MNIFGLILVTQVAFPSDAPRDPQRVARTQFRDSIVAAELRFLYQWGEAWRMSEAGRHEIQTRVIPFGPQLQTNRYHLIACRFTSPGSRGVRVVSDGGRSNFIREAVLAGRGIANLGTSDGICPSWFVDGLAMPTDERFGIDNALALPHQATIRSNRDLLLAGLDSASTLFPDDDWLVGQRVRFAVDQRDFRRAIGIGDGCRAGAWWCHALRGYARAAQGEFVGAESAFDSAMRSAPDSVRCAWTGVQNLIDSTARAENVRAGCRERERIADRAWWMADPFYSVPGNERRVEHFVRRVLVDLKSALYRDERWEWTLAERGAARRELLDRFGWPSYAWWGGQMHDVIMGCACVGQGYTDEFTRQPNDLTTTYEYDRERYHFMPKSEALRDPFEAEYGDWTITDPSLIPGRGEAFRGSALWQRSHPKVVRADSATFMSMTWWPVEHAASSRPLVQLPEGQIAILRREQGTLVAMATDLLPKQLKRDSGRVVAGSIVASPAPDTVLTISRMLGTVGSHIVPRGIVPPQPAIVGFEFLNDSASPGGRLRFGLKPLTPLASMRADERDVSAPVLIKSDATIERKMTTDDALDRMTTSVNFARNETIGLYWESYGFEPSEPVSIAVWIERYTPQGLFRRLGNSLSLTRDLNTPVVTQWTESQAPSNAHIIAGRVPVIGRTIALDVSGLAPGDYWVDVAMTAAGKEPVRSRRGFSIK